MRPLSFPSRLLTPSPPGLSPSCSLYLPAEADTAASCRVLSQVLCWHYRSPALLSIIFPFVAAYVFLLPHFSPPPFFWFKRSLIIPSHSPDSSFFFFWSLISEVSSSRKFKRSQALLSGFEMIFHRSVSHRLMNTQPPPPTHTHTTACPAPFLRLSLHCVCSISSSSWFFSPTSQFSQQGVSHVWKVSCTCRYTQDWSTRF